MIKVQTNARGIFQAAFRTSSDMWTQPSAPEMENAGSNNPMQKLMPWLDHPPAFSSWVHTNLELAFLLMASSTTVRMTKNNICSTPDTACIIGRIFLPKVRITKPINENIVMSKNVCHPFGTYASWFSTIRASICSARNNVVLTKPTCHAIDVNQPKMELELCSLDSPVYRNGTNLESSLGRSGLLGARSEKSRNTDHQRLGTYALIEREILFS